MTVILVDCKHIGIALRGARKSANFTLVECAKILGITTHDLVRYERGTKLIPHTTIQRLMHFGFLVMRARNATKTQK